MSVFFFRMHRWSTDNNDNNWNISCYEPAFGEIAEKLWEKIMIYTCLCFCTTLILNTGSIKFIIDLGIGILGLL